MTHPLESRVRDALREVIDPEAGVNIVDLGLVYGIGVTEDAVKIDLTMTSPACPLGDVIVEDVETVLKKSALAGRRIEVQLVWDPPWEPAMMSEAARKHFAW